MTHRLMSTEITTLRLARLGNISASRANLARRVFNTTESPSALSSASFDSVASSLTHNSQQDVPEVIGQGQGLDHLRICLG